jgi:hypothetical protein
MEVLRGHDEEIELTSRPSQEDMDFKGWGRSEGALGKRVRVNESPRSSCVRDGQEGRYRERKST